MAVNEYQGIREEMETDGYKLDDGTFQELVVYARRKAKSAGKSENYLPFLLPDVIREWFIRRSINAVTITAMEIEKIYCRRK